MQFLSHREHGSCVLQTTAQGINCFRLRITSNNEATTRTLRMVLSVESSGTYTGCFKKSFTTLKAYRNLYRGHTQRFELSKM